MNPVIERIVTTLKELSLSRKIGLGLFVMVLVAGFTTMFVWTNKTQFRAAYSGLTKEDAAAVVDILKESNTPYRLTGDGTTIMVPESVVYDVRLTMAKSGVPNGGGVGYEILIRQNSGPLNLYKR